MTALEAAYTVLQQAGEPLHYREVTQRILTRGLWQTSGKTPEATISAQLSVAIKSKGKRSRFRRVRKGVYAVQDTSLGPNTQSPEKAGTGETLSFTAAAEYILENEGNGQPMHYRAITDRALQQGIIQTAGQTPEATMYAQILQENQRRKRRGEPLRFERVGKGLIGLTQWLPVGLERQIQQHNKKVRAKLHESLRALSAKNFESLVGQLLIALGFNDVTVTAIGGDGGIDVRGTLVVGDAIETRMAVQAKKWKANVQAPTVQQVRGSLGAHEQGLIITTSDFSKGARLEALRQDAIPVGLMSGEQLVGQLIEHGIGVQRTPHDLLTLDDDFGEVDE